MREILFRGKRIDNEEWVYGSFCMDALEQFNGLCGVDGFIRLYDKKIGKMKSYEVDRETVGQYTGLTDKNGKKIFEGDIIQFCTGMKLYYIVEFNLRGFIVRRYDICDEIIHVYNCPCEVIGNIHDDPELLKVGDEE